MANGKVVTESVALLPRSGGTLSLAQWCHLFFFMASGIATPLLVGFVKRQGACGVRTAASRAVDYFGPKGGKPQLMGAAEVQAQLAKAFGVQLSAIE